MVESLERRGLVAPKEAERAGRLPERTVYELTNAGRVEMHDWLTDLLSTPVKEHPAFQAALSFLPALPPADVVALLRERARRLAAEAAQAHAARELVEKQGLPRLFWVEDEHRDLIREAELAYVQRLVREIEEGTLDDVLLRQTGRSLRDAGRGAGATAGTATTEVEA